MNWSKLATTISARPSVSLGFPPSPRQQLFLDAVEREQLYGGAKGGGKSVALCIKAIQLSVHFPGNRGGMFRQDLTDFRESTLVTFFNICPRELILDHHQTYRHIVIKTNGEPSVITYGGLGDPQEMESVKGKEFGWIAIDEPSEVPVEAYRMLRAQLRWRLPNGQFPPYMSLLASNPEPGWVEEQFRDLIEETSDTKPTASREGRIFVRALPRDNPYLPPGLEKELRASSPAEWVKKYLDGSWEVSEGQVFKEFDRGTHCISIPPPAFLAQLKLVASIDHATTGVTCMCVDGVDPDGNVFALGSYYERNRLISEHSAAMKRLMDRWVDATSKRQFVESQRHPDPSVYPACTAFEYILIDPSTQAKTLQNRGDLWSVQDEYRRNGIPTVAAWNTLETGVNLLAEYIHVRPTHIHPLTGQRPSASFFIVASENQEGIREIIGWRRTISERGQVKYVGPDHWLDNQRYIVMSRPEPPRMTVKDVVSLGTMERKAQRAMDKFDRTFGRDGKTNQWFPGGNDADTWFPQGIN